MSRRKRVEAWAVVGKTNGIVIDVAANERWLISAGSNERTVRLVEHNPAAEAVVRAVIRAIMRDEIEEGNPDNPIAKAVARYKKSHKRKP